MRDIRFNRERMMMGAGYYASKGITPQTSQIRVEVDLATGKGTYDFDIKKKGSDKSSTEKTITDTDLFIARAIGMALMVDIDATPGLAPLLSYPLVGGSNPIPAGIKGFANANAFGLYNGVLTMKTDQSVNLSGYPTSGFLNIPRTQPFAILDSTDAAVTSGVYPEFNIENVLQELPEILMIAGNHKTEIKLEAPIGTGISLAADTGGTSKVVLLIEGWLFSGGAQVQYREDGNPFKGSI